MSTKEHSNKYLCRICNIWIADNRPQREQHESGQKHKTAKVRLLKEIAKKNASRRTEKASAVANVAAQQLLEHVAKAIDGSSGRAGLKGGDEKQTEGDDENGTMEVTGADQTIDQNGFPVSAQEIYAWQEDTQVEEGDATRDDYIPTEALGEFAPDEPEDEPLASGKKENGDGTGNLNSGLQMPQEEQDPEERKLIQMSFKKRSAPKHRRKRRAR